MGEAGSAFLRLAHLLIAIFSCITLIFISFLHLGQYSGKLNIAVSLYTLVRLLPPQIGQQIHLDSFGSLFTLSSIFFGVALHCMSGSEKSYWISFQRSNVCGVILMNYDFRLNIEKDHTIQQITAGRTW